MNKKLIRYCKMNGVVAYENAAGTVTMENRFLNPEHVDYIEYVDVATIEEVRIQLGY
jgi:hypothetical protein